MAEPDADGVPRAGARAFLDRVTAAVHGMDRPELLERLSAERLRLDREEFTVVVAGEFGRGKSALVNGLVGAPVCGVSALAATTVQTVVRYGPRPQAWALDAAGPGEPPQRRPLPLPEATRLSLSGADAEPLPVALEVELPRRLLRDGLTLVDTAGVGGGFSSAGAAATIRSLTFADALLFVTDAAGELTAPEVEFLAEALAGCPTALAVVTKTDLYPQWRRIVELDREHLAAAGLDVAVLPVSTVLRELAVSTGDPALAAESGFPVLVGALGDGLRRRRRADGCRSAVAAAVAVLERAGDQVAVESAGLTDPSRQQERLDRLKAAEQRLGRLHGASARWQETLADEMRRWRREIPRDLSDRLADLRTEVHARLAAAGNPDRHWDDFEPWFHREVNMRLTAHHRAVLERIQASVDTVGGQFELEQGELGIALGAQAEPAAQRLQRPDRSRASWLDLGVTAARGFSVSGAVMNIVIVAAGGSLATVGVPLTAALGAFFALRYVRGTRQAQDQQAGRQAEQAVVQYLQEVQTSTMRVDEELVEAAYIQLRDRLGRLSEDLRRDAQALVAAAARTADADAEGVTGRLAELERARAELDRLGRSGRTALAAAGQRPGFARDQLAAGQHPGFARDQLAAGQHPGFARDQLAAGQRPGFARDQ